MEWGKRKTEYKKRSIGISFRGNLTGRRYIPGNIGRNEITKNE
jgi:hypothetical protein